MDYSLKNHILVIGRQFGSGGRALGKIAAERMGVKFYDRELLAEASTHFGLDAQLLHEADEKKPSMLRSLIDGGISWMGSSLEGASMGGESLYAMQSKTITMLAQEGGAVFVGRTADYILRHHPLLTSIFLHAPIEIRAQRIVNRGECATLKEAIEKAKKIDHIREGYYNYFTGRQWGNAHNYHLSVDTTRFADIESCADFIINFLNRRKP